MLQHVFEHRIVRSLSPRRHGTPRACAWGRLIVVALLAVALHGTPALAVGPPPVEQGDDALQAWVKKYDAAEDNDLAGHGAKVLDAFQKKWASLDTDSLSDRQARMLRKNLLAWAEKRVKKQVARGAAGGTSDADAGEGSANPNSSTEAADNNRYAIVPLEGAIGGSGGEIYATALDHVLKRCVERGIGHVVFDIDSEGGAVAEAKKLRDVLKKHDKDLVYHGRIHNATGVAVMLPFFCDDWQVHRRASVGARAPEQEKAQDGKTTRRRARVQTKFDSDLAADIREIAEQKGHPGALAHAMTTRSASASGWVDADGAAHFAATPNMRGSGEAVFEDGETSVLTLSAAQLKRLKLAEPIPSNGQLSFADAVDGRPRRMRVDAARTMRRWAVKVEQRQEQAAQQEVQREKLMNNLAERVPEAYRVLKSHVREAVDADPRSFTYVYYLGSMKLTGQSFMKWKEKTDLAIEAWQRVGKECEMLAEAIKKAERMDVDVSVSRSEVIEIYNRARNKIRNLRANRDNRNIDGK